MISPIITVIECEDIEENGAGLLICIVEVEDRNMASVVCALIG